MSTEDRRTPDATRICFEGLVEMGSASGPTFEAQAINVSEDGLQVRSAYLPEPGHPLTCRFDIGPGQSVLAAGEVAWAHGTDRGGELGIRFTDMEPESIEALKRACAESLLPPLSAQPGSKVRLHIDGLASPMRAKIRDSRTGEITVGSELGFLQVGKQLELEDPGTGSTRPASIDCVEVVVDPESRVPQLVVTLRYADVGPATASSAAGSVVTGADHPAETSAAKAQRGQTDGTSAATPQRGHGMDEAAQKMKGAVARNVAQIGPALERFANRAKTTVALLAAKHRDRAEMDGAQSRRRTTAPPHGGGLRTSGRQVVRGEAGETGAEDGASELAPKMARRKIALASAVMIAAIVAGVSIKKAHHEPAPAPEAVAPASPTAPAVATAAPGPATSAPPAPPAAPLPAETTSAFASTPMPASSGAVTTEDPDAVAKRHARVTPFANGPVHHGNILRLKMDGPIESLEGAQQPMGFVVKVPGRRSLEAAGPLAARDSRIAAIKVSNETAGAELTVAFRDGVPNYRVSARGDNLVIALAQVGTFEETIAKKDQAGGKALKRTKQEPEK